MQAVFRELLEIPLAPLVFVDVKRLCAQCILALNLIPRLHVEGEKILVTVAVKIGRIYPHRKLGMGLKTLFSDQFKALPTSVHVQIVIFMKVVRNIHIEVAVTVEIACNHTEPIADRRAQHPSSLGLFLEFWRRGTPDVAKK